MEVGLREEKEEVVEMKVVKGMKKKEEEERC